MLTCTIIVLALSRHLESRYVHVILLVDTFYICIRGQSRVETEHCSIVYFDHYHVRSAVVQNFC